MRLHRHEEQMKWAGYFNSNWELQMCISKPLNILGLTFWLPTISWNLSRKTNIIFPSGKMNAKGGRVWSGAYDSILDAETQLVAKVWSPDQHGGHRRTPHDIQLYPGLILQALKREQSTVDMATTETDRRGQSRQHQGQKRPRRRLVISSTPKAPAIQC